MLRFFSCKLGLEVPEPLFAAQAVSKQRTRDEYTGEHIGQTPRPKTIGNTDVWPRSVVLPPGTKIPPFRIKLRTQLLYGPEILQQ